MHSLTVEKRSRGLLGPKYRVVLHIADAWPEPILAEWSKYADDPRYRVTYTDHTDYLGDHDHREPREDESIDWATEPLTDDEFPF